MSATGVAQSLPIVPLPQSVEATGGSVSFDPRRARVVAAAGLESAGSWLEAELAELASRHEPRGGTPELVVELAVASGPHAIAPAVGMDPSGIPHDERHTLEIRDGRVSIAGPGHRAVLRGVATLLQLISAPRASLPIGRIEDGPRYAWRGLSLDVVRHPFTVEEIDRVIDLLARYKLNVLHLHLTDSQGWRLSSSRHPLLEGVAGGPLIGADDLDALTERAEALGVTILPEIDLPGHSAAAVRAYPELAADGGAARLGFLDPGIPAVRSFIESEVTEFSERSRGPFVHVGGDEPFGMSNEAYVEAVRLAVDAAHQAGKRVVAWQEAVRAHAFRTGDVIQFWIGDENHIDADAKKAELPVGAHRFVDAMVELFARAPGDLPLAADSKTPVLISSNDVLYLDRKYAEPAATAEGENRRQRLGFPDYPAKTLRQMHEWMPEDLVAGHDVEVAGVEAAIWAESIECFDDLAFLLLPRLGSAAERAWQPVATGWEDYRARIASHHAVWRHLGWEAAFEPRTHGSAASEDEGMRAIR